MLSLLEEDWGVVPYADAWKRQTTLFEALIEAKKAGKPTEGRLITCQHPHVYTIGRSGKEQNMLMSEEQLQKIGATYYHIDRGGDVTYHGPGQLVGELCPRAEVLHPSVGRGCHLYLWQLWNTGREGRRSYRSVVGR